MITNLISAFQEKTEKRGEIIEIGLNSNDSHIQLLTAYFKFSIAKEFNSGSFKDTLIIMNIIKDLSEKEVFAKISEDFAEFYDDLKYITFIDYDKGVDKVTELAKSIQLGNLAKLNDY